MTRVGRLALPPASPHRGRSGSYVQMLILGGSELTDAGLVHLKGLINLRTLDLGNTKVTDAGMIHLKGLNNLEGLSLAGTKVSDVGIAQLKRPWALL
jgi:internalin A